MNVTQVLSAAIMMGCRTMPSICVKFLERLKLKNALIHSANLALARSLGGVDIQSIPTECNAESDVDDSSNSVGSESQTHQPLHRVLRIVKSPAASACSSPRSSPHSFDESFVDSDHVDSSSPQSLNGASASDSATHVSGSMHQAFSAVDHLTAVKMAAAAVKVAHTVQAAELSRVESETKYEPVMRQRSTIGLHRHAQNALSNSMKQETLHNSGLRSNGCMNNNMNDKKYCRECNRSFATVGSYTRHLRMIHYKLRPLNCEVCGHAFYQRSDLKKHIQRQHQRSNSGK